MKKYSIHQKPKNADAKQKALLKQAARNQLQKRKGSKPYQFGNSNASRWRHPGIFLLAGIVAVVLLIPTLVVVPFSTTNQTGVHNAEKGTAKIPAPKTETKASAFSVAVMRTASEQVENVPLETYVTRVVASEMPADFEMEALKAQSLAARTYIVNHLLSKNQGDTKVTDTVQHQVYKNEEELRKIWGSDFDRKMNKLKKAVAATSGQILTYQKQPITPSFFSTSNGFTENSEDYWGQELPYLRSVKSPWDEHSPKFRSQEVFTPDQVGNALGVNVTGDTAKNFEVTRTKSGRVAQVRLGDKTFSGKKVRELLELPSNDFQIEQKNNHFIFKTKGFGHGVGMSQYGANGMAKEGKTYDDIVKYYYKGIEIRSVDEAAPALVSR